MPNINLTDSRGRDAQVKAEGVQTPRNVRYIDSEGDPVYTRKILQATIKHDYNTLVKKYETPESLGRALFEGDPEIDTEIFGRYLQEISRVYINPDEEIVYRIEPIEIKLDTEGEEISRKIRERLPSNTDDSQYPLKWTGKMLKKSDAFRRFVFSGKMQITHVNGLTYDFLHSMATELAEAKSLLLIGGGKKGSDPLIFRRGSVPYRGFLEGRVDGDRYALILHLSKMELKPPA